MCAVALVLLGMMGAWLGGYLLRSPLGPSESLVELIDFGAPVVARCGDVRRVWTAARGTERYGEFERSVEGRAFLGATPFARAAERISRGSRVLGRPALGFFDILSDEVMVAAVPARNGRWACLLAARVGPRANVLLGLHAWSTEAERLPTGSGDWWMVVNGGLAWTKVGDVVVAGTNSALLGRFVASARSGRRRAGRLAGAGSGDESARVVIDLPWGGVRAGDEGLLPGSCELSVRAGERPAARDAEDAAGWSRFGGPVSGYLPAETCAGAVWWLPPRSFWRMVLGVLSEGEREGLVGYCEDRLPALLGEGDFDRGVLGRVTGEFAVGVSQEPDPWLSLASGRRLPTLSLFIRVRSDRRFLGRLDYAMLEVKDVLSAPGGRFAVRVDEVVHRGHAIKLIQVRRPGSAQAPAAGFFVAPDDVGPGHSLLVASTSVDWLKRAIDTRSGVEPSLGAEGWFRSLAGGAGGERVVFAFVRGDLVARALGRMRGSSRGSVRPAVEGWLELFGGVGCCGRLGADGVLRGEVWLPGERLRLEPVPAARRER